MAEVNWTYRVQLDTVHGVISLLPGSDSPLVSGTIIPVPFGTNATITLERPPRDIWEFDSIVFWLFGNESATIRAKVADPPTSLPTAIYNFDQPPLVFDLRVQSLATDRISFSNNNQLGADSILNSITINFQIVLRQNNLVYISKDPQIEDEPEGSPAANYSV